MAKTSSASSPAAAAEPLRIGLVGMDTSDVPAFTELFHDPAPSGDLVVEIVGSARERFEASSSGLNRARPRGTLLKMAI